MGWLIVLDLFFSISAADAMISRIEESRNRINEKYNIKYKNKKTTLFKNILDSIIFMGLMLTPGINIYALLWSCISKDEEFDKAVKNALSINSILEDKITGEIYKPKKEKFCLKNIFKKKPKTDKSKELLKNLKNKVSKFLKSEETTTNKKLLDDLNTKFGETPKPKEETKPAQHEEPKPKEETKPFIRTALQPEGQLPFEIVWEGSVYSGTRRALESTPINSNINKELLDEVEKKVGEPKVTTNYDKNGTINLNIENSSFTGPIIHDYNGQPIETPEDLKKSVDPSITINDLGGNGFSRNLHL